MKLKYLLLGILIFTSIVSNAHDFAAKVNGQCLYFKITNKGKKTVAVTFNGRVADKKAPEVSGVIEIPAKVSHDNVVYEVNSIGQKAFANADRLTGIVIPSGVEAIGDFAFEDCDSLRSIVFPGNPVNLGQGVFFKCPNISDVSIGSEWKSIDLTMFRWSDRLTSINIPAKIEKIKGVKKLAVLNLISVDQNNAKFSSYDGMLYSKDGLTLLACPRACRGKVVIKEGTSKILPGALIDCIGITSIDFPPTVQSVSFRETSRMRNLETIVLRGENPITTGYLKGKGKFFFQLANPKVSLVVKSTDKEKYISDLATTAGEYSENEGGIPYIVNQSELPTKKSFKGVKNFDNY